VKHFTSEGRAVMRIARAAVALQRRARSRDPERIAESIRLTERLRASGEPVDELANVEHLEVADVGLEHVAVAGDQHASAAFAGATR
jgi:hypothetical protein